MVRTHKDLDVWKKAIMLTNAVYDATGVFPKEELYGLSSQMRRAAVSIASNIAEGFARGSRKELLQFLSISRGSLAELETQCPIAWHRKYVSDDQNERLNVLIDGVSRLLTKLMQSLRSSASALQKNLHASPVTLHEMEPVS